MQTDHRADEWLAIRQQGVVPATVRRRGMRLFQSSVGRDRFGFWPGCPIGAKAALRRTQQLHLGFNDQCRVDGLSTMRMSILIRVSPRGTVRTSRLKMSHTRLARLTDRSSTRSATRFMAYSETTPISLSSGTAGNDESRTAPSSRVRRRRWNRVRRHHRLGRVWFFHKIPARGSRMFLYGNIRLEDIRGCSTMDRHA